MVSADDLLIFKLRSTKPQGMGAEAPKVQAESKSYDSGERPAQVGIEEATALFESMKKQSVALAARIEAESEAAKAAAKAAAEKARLEGIRKVQEERLAQLQKQASQKRSKEYSGQAAIASQKELIKKIQQQNEMLIRRQEEAAAAKAAAKAAEQERARQEALRKEQERKALAKLREANIESRKHTQEKVVNVSKALYDAIEAQSMLIEKRRKLEADAEKARQAAEAEASRPAYEKAYSEYSKTAVTENVKPLRGQWPFKREQAPRNEIRLLTPTRYTGGGSITDESTSGESRAMTKEESTEAAKGLKCLGHPWRDAYAVCNYCKMGFCYSDIAEYGGSYYCLEDLGKVAGTMPLAESQQTNTVLKASSMAFIVSALVIGYFIAPELYYILFVAGLSSLGQISRLGTAYSVAVLNLLLAALSIAAAWILIRNPSKNVRLAQVIASIIILTMVYEFLVSDIAYLAIISVFFFGTLVTILIGKTFEGALQYSQALGTPEVIWPKAETF